MIKKIDILGIQLDNYTVREAIRQVETYLDNNALNSIEIISMRMLIDSEEDPVLKEVMSSLNLAVIGEKEILQAADIGTMQRIRETEEKDFFFEFFKRMERNKKSVFLLGKTGERTGYIREKLQQEFPKLEFVGEYAVDNCAGDLDAVINDMNATTPAVIVSVLPSPMQEHFFRDHRDKMNANIWFGIGEMENMQSRHGVRNFFRSHMHLGRLKNSMEKYRENRAAREMAGNEMKDEAQ